MPRMISPMVSRQKPREGRGFSLGELREAGLTAGEAKIRGVPFDARRKSTHEENVQILKEWYGDAKENKFRVPRPFQFSKGRRGRTSRGLTSAGRKSRGLVRGKKRD
jgi:large subunit ribosomal protein L13e